MQLNSSSDDGAAVERRGTSPTQAELQVKMRDLMSQLQGVFAEMSRAQPTTNGGAFESPPPHLNARHSPLMSEVPFSAVEQLITASAGNSPDMPPPMPPSFLFESEPHPMMRATSPLFPGALPQVRVGIGQSGNHVASPVPTYNPVGGVQPGFNRNPPPPPVLDNDRWMAHMMQQATSAQHITQSWSSGIPRPELDHTVAITSTGSGRGGRGGSAHSPSGGGNRGRHQNSGHNANQRSHWQVGSADRNTSEPSPTFHNPRRSPAAPEEPSSRRIGGAVEDAPTAPGQYAIVEFKRQRVRKYQCPSYIAPGQYVIVDGDRGQDCGLVVCTAAVDANGSVRVQCMDGSTVDPERTKLENGRVLRPAETQEIHMLHGEMATLERQALQMCRERSAQLGLPIEVIDCEFQFDRKKVSFYFDSDTSVDFRALVRDLYKYFGARIWMENINSKVRNVVPPGALSQQQKSTLKRGPRPTSQGHQ